VNAPPPTYPASAVQDRLEGKVLLKLLVNEDGKPTMISVAQSSGHVELDQAATAAVESWQFKPGERDHRPVESWIMVPVSFSLDEDAAEAGDAES